VVQDYQVYRGQELKLHQKQIFLTLLKQGEDFQPVRFAEKSQKKKVKDGENLKGICPQFQVLNRTKRR
jgi:hypothetical protein